MPDLLVEARDLARVYTVGASRIVALARADCRIEAGARIALAGPSGSGKSTLLQIIAGIDTASSGTIAWPAFGRRENLRPKHIACVFQSPSLVDALTVEENVELPLLLDDRPFTNTRIAASKILLRFGLAELARKLPEELSGGQAQRVAFARAVVSQPQLILADEPSGQLDSETARRFLNVALEILDAEGIALLVATHDRSVAERMRTQWRIAHGTLEPAA